MKKILFVATESSAAMRYFAATIANVMARQEDFDVRCVCVNNGNGSYRNVMTTESHPIYVEYPQNKLLKLMYKFWPFKIIKALRKAEEEFQPDFVHFLTGDFTLAQYILLHKKDNYSYTVHDLHPHEVVLPTLFDKFMFHLVRRGYRICWESMNLLTTSSQSQCKELQQMFPNKKCVFTPFPTLVMEDIMKGTVVPPEVAKEKDYILFFGSINEYKGVDLLIRAFESSSKIKQKLVIAGRGVDYPYASKDIIRIDRFIAEEELAELFKRAKLVVYPYRSATMSGVLSYPYYFNIPVLSSDIPFFKDNETKCSHFFKTGDAADLQRKMEELLSLDMIAVDTDAYKAIYSEDALTAAYRRLYGMQ